MQPVVLRGTIAHGEGKGHRAGFPTANLDIGSAALPPYGVYASLLKTEKGCLIPGVTNVGTRPTADDNPQPTVETWMPDFEGDLYGQRAVVILLEYLRAIRPFESMEALKRQIDSDAARAAALAGGICENSVVSHSADETKAFGKMLAGFLRRGDVLTLTGPLGAGKSELARGIARGLGIEGVLPSPTFTILNMYSQGRIPLYHYDWYRIEDPEELTAIGVEEHLPGDGITLVEWAEQAPELLPEDILDLRLIPLDESARLITLTPRGGFRPVREWISEMKKKC